jgi:MFS family permease
MPQVVAGSFGALLAARLAFGVGYGLVWTAALCWLAVAANGPTALGGSVASAGVGGVAGPAASGVLTEQLGLAVGVDCPFPVRGLGDHGIRSWYRAGHDSGAGSTITIGCIGRRT